MKSVMYHVNDKKPDGSEKYYIVIWDDGSMSPAFWVGTCFQKMCGTNEHRMDHDGKSNHVLLWVGLGELLEMGSRGLK